LSQVHPIMSGGPRGTMALETETAPGELLHCSNDAAAPTAPSHAAKDALIFIAVPQCELAFAGQGEDTVTVLEDRFLAARENGFMPSREDEMTWTCITPGSQARLTW